MIRVTCVRDAPSVLSNTLSRMRSRRVAATALNSTGMPISRQKTVRNRIASVIFRRIPFTVSRMSERSTLEMFGYRSPIER